MMKFIILLLVLFLSICANAQWYYGPGEATDLENNIGFDKHQQKVITGDAQDPTLSAKFGAPGSIYLRSATPTGLYLKQDYGTSTNWAKLLDTSIITLGDLTSSTTGVTVTGGAGALFHNARVDIASATSTQTGLLTGADWSNFNSKQSTLTLGTATGTLNRIGVSGGSNAVIGSGLTIDLSTSLLPSPGAGDTGKVLTSSGANSAYWQAIAGISTGTLYGSTYLNISNGTGSLVSHDASATILIPTNEVLIGNALGGASATPFKLANLVDTSLISAATSGKILAFNGTSWTPQDPQISAGQGVDYFLDDTAHGAIGGYFSLLKQPNAIAEVIDSVSVTNASATIESYASTPTLIGSTVIEGGVWLFNTYADASSVTGGVSNITIDMYKRTNPGGVETLLFSVTSPNLTTTVGQLYSYSTVQGSFAANTTDYLVARYRGITTRVAATTIRLYHNGNARYSHFQTPLVTRHNDLAGLQGGTAGQYYHLTQTQNLNVSGLLPSAITTDIGKGLVVTASGTAAWSNIATATGTLSATGTGLSVSTGLGRLVGGDATISLLSYTATGTSKRLTATGTGTVLGGPLTFDINTGLIPLTNNTTDVGKVLTVTGTDTASWQNTQGWVWTDISTNTLMAKNHGYIADGASRTQMMLPEFCDIGDMVGIVGRTAGWDVVSNPMAASQTLYAGSYTSPTSNNSSIIEYSSSNTRDASFIACSYTNKEWTVTNVQGIVNAVPTATPTPGGTTNYWGDGSDGAVTISSNTSLTATQDGDAVVKNYTNLTIDAGSVLTTSARNRGMILYVSGNLVVNGQISMNARGGAVNPATDVDGAGQTVGASGLIFRRLKSGGADTDSGNGKLNGAGTAAIAAENNQGAISVNGKIYYITRSGAAGGTAVNCSAALGLPGNAGSAGGAGQSGGGGTGTCGRTAGTVLTGAGGAGTCFSGGSASGGVSANNSYTGADGGLYGGAGGAAYSYSSGIHVGGGAGNPGGAGGGSSGIAGSTGTGGLVAIIVKGNIAIGATGKITSNGSNGGSGPVGNTSGGGGGSGGGNILLLRAGTLTNNGSIEANGGTGGDWPYAGPAGNGGAGSIQNDTIDP